MLPPKLEDAIRSNPALSAVFHDWDRVELPNAWVVAGSIVQSYWNSVHEFPPLFGISDIDLIYFDPCDLTEAAESHHSSRVSEMFGHTGMTIDVKNEARVHLWYEAEFGYPIKPYVSSESAIDTFPTTAGSIGVRPRFDELESYASFGYSDLLNLVVRANKRQIRPGIYAKKVSRWKELWPRLEIVEWDED